MHISATPVVPSAIQLSSSPGGLSSINHHAVASILASSAPSVTTDVMSGGVPPGTPSAVPAIAAPLPGQAALGKISVFRPPEPFRLYRTRPQSLDLSYRAEATFEYALFFVVKFGWLTLECHRDECLALSSLHPDLEAMISQVPRLMSVDFSSLLQPDLVYASRLTIDKSRVRLLAACAVHYGLDFGLVVRYLAGEYTAAHRDVPSILAAVRDHVPPHVLQHMGRILTTGCPSRLNWFETASNKAAFLRRGNHPAVRQHASVVDSTLVKEVRNCHLIPFPRWMCVFSATAHHVPQNILLKPGKKPRLIWDGKTKKYVWEITMNEVTSMEEELDIDFGIVFLQFCTWIWNCRISYPDRDIFLAFLDISSCFRFPRTFPDLVGAFGFIVGALFFAANAMVFGSVASASSWEPFRRAISALATAYFYQDGLESLHEAFLSRIQWDRSGGVDNSATTDGLIRPQHKLVQATKCSKNPGVFDEGGRRLPTPHCMYVDDNLLADIDSYLNRAVASAVEATYVVMGRPRLDLRPSALALDKLDELIISTRQVLLGYIFDTREMTVSIPPVFRKEVATLLQNTWHSHRESFTLHELELLVGKLGRIAQVFRPLYYLMSHLYASVAYALRENRAFLMSSNKEFREMMKRAKSLPTASESSEDIRLVNYALSQTAKKLHDCKQRYRISPSMREELVFLRAFLLDDSYELCTPVAHIVTRDFSLEAAADSCKFSGGGYSSDLSFWWCLHYPPDIVARAHLPNNKSGDYISINCLEMLCIIVNFAAVIYTCWHDDIDLSDYPVLLNWCDNTSACSWVNVRCKSSLIGRALGRFFCGMLMGSKLGIHTEWLPTHLNVVADDISRLKHSVDRVDYSQLFETHPALRSCRQFQPSPFLLTTLWEILSSSVSPDPLIVARFEPETLGSFTSLSSLIDTD